MESNPLFSVIMPVYNVERYLPKAVNSVLSQTFSDFELILVDDCTPDNSGKICDDFAQIDSRISVIHKQYNEGLGFARNSGLAASKGNWIIFIDSDDWVDNSMLEQLSKKLMQLNPQIMVFGLVQEIENKSEKVVSSIILKVAETVANNGEEIGGAAIALEDSRCFPYVCNKVYNRKFLYEFDIRFKKIKMIEDFLFNIEAFSHADCVVVIGAPFYHYRKPTHQTLASAYLPDFFELCKLRFQKEKNFIESMGIDSEKIKQSLINIHIKHVISTLVRNCSANSPLTLREKYRETFKILNDANTKAAWEYSSPKGIQFKVLYTVFKNQWCLISMGLAEIINFLQHC